MLWALHIRSTSSRAAVTETPLVDMIAMSWLLGELDPLEQRLKPFLLDEQHRAKIAIRSARADAGGI